MNKNIYLNQPTKKVAQDLLGKLLVRKYHGKNSVI